MSALGQKQTCAVQNVMSALLPKADMCSALGDVRFVPIADIASPYPSPRRRAHQRDRICGTEGFGGLEIDHQLDFHGLLHR